MNTQVEKLLTEVNDDVIRVVVRSVLNDPEAEPIGRPTLSEINAHHSDSRTVGIVKVSGKATTSTGETENWSSVVKIIDLTTPQMFDAVNWTRPENEPKVYELGLLANDQLPFRPATCYSTQLADDGQIVLWIEDLTSYPQPPWSVEHFIDAANHIGQFNGYHFASATELPIELPTDSYYRRWTDPTRIPRYIKIAETVDEPITKRVYRNTPVEVGLRFAELFEAALELAKKLPHGLMIGDSQHRNMFPGNSETIGIDWASLTYDPVGSDVGALTISALGASSEEMQLVVQHETQIYESYISGLESAGWTGDLDHIRLAFFCQVGGLVNQGLAPAMYEEFKINDEKRRWLEQRLGVPFEEIPEHIASKVDMFPKYADELESLIERVRRSL